MSDDEARQLWQRLHANDPAAWVAHARATADDRAEGARRLAAIRAMESDDARAKHEVCKAYARWLGARHERRAQAAVAILRST